eukprot:3440729-Prymnesium_polylepis.1
MFPGQYCSRSTSSRAKSHWSSSSRHSAYWSRVCICHRLQPLRRSAHDYSWSRQAALGSPVCHRKHATSSCPCVWMADRPSKTLPSTFCTNAAPLISSVARG